MRQTSQHKWKVLLRNQSLAALHRFHRLCITLKPNCRVPRTLLSVNTATLSPDTGNGRCLRNRISAMIWIRWEDGTKEEEVHVNERGMTKQRLVGSQDWALGTRPQLGLGYQVKGYKGTVSSTPEDIPSSLRPDTTSRSPRRRWHPIATSNPHINPDWKKRRKKRLLSITIPVASLFSIFCI